MRKRVSATLISLILIISTLFVSASAVDESMHTVEPRYTGLPTFTTTLILGTGTAQCHSSSTLSNGSYTQTLTMRLQRSVNQSVWTTLQSWTSNGGFVATTEGTRSITHGYYYRLYCTANVYTSSGSWYGSNTKISDSQYY